jgi:hypothetical protein
MSSGFFPHAFLMDNDEHAGHIISVLLLDEVNHEMADCPKTVKKPMDLATVKKKLENTEHPTGGKSKDDFHLMIRQSVQFRRFICALCRR